MSGMAGQSNLLAWDTKLPKHSLVTKIWTKLLGGQYVYMLWGRMVLKGWRPSVGEVGVDKTFVYIGQRPLVWEDGADNMKTFSVGGWFEYDGYLWWGMMVWIRWRSSVLEDGVDMIETWTWGGWSRYDEDLQWGKMVWIGWIPTNSS